MTYAGELIQVAVKHTRADNFQLRPGTTVYENMTSFYFPRRFSFELSVEQAKQELGCGECRLRIQSGHVDHFLDISLKRTKASKKLPKQLVAHCQIKLVGGKKTKEANCFTKTTYLERELLIAQQENYEEEL